MKQLYYTSCKAGDGLQTTAGLQVQAATADTHESELRSAVRYCYYFLPQGDEYRTDVVQPEKAPVRFAFLKTDELGSIALRARYLGLDPASGRPGNPFVHLVFDAKQEEIDALTVLASWETAFWVASPETSRKRLDSVSTLPLQANFERQLGVDLADLKTSERAKFLISALLQPERSRQIHIAGDVFDIVKLLRIVARILPPSLRRDLTFTTFEKSVDAQRARIVGTTWGTLPQTRDLPESSYTGIVAGMNLQTGRTSTGVRLASAAAFGIECLCKPDLKRLDAFLSYWDAEALAGDAIDLHLAAWTAAQGEAEPRKTDLELILRTPRLQKLALTSDAFAARLVGLLKADLALSGELGASLRQFIMPHARAASDLSQWWLTTATAAAQAGESAKLQALFSMLPALADGARAKASVLANVASSAPTLSSSVRAIMMPLAMDERQCPDPKVREQWTVAPSPEDLARILGDLPAEDARIRALVLNLRHISGPVIRRLHADPRLTAAALNTLAEAKLLSAASGILKNLGDGSPPGYLNQLIATGVAVNPLWFSALLHTVPASDMGRFIETHGRLLLEFGGTTVADFLATAANTNPMALQDHANVREIYAKAVDAKIIRDARLAQRVRAWVAIANARATSWSVGAVEQLEATLPDLRSMLTPADIASLQQTLMREVALRPIGDCERHVLYTAVIILGSPKNADGVKAAWIESSRIILAMPPPPEIPKRVVALIRIRAGMFKGEPPRGALTAFAGSKVLEPEGVALLAVLKKADRDELSREAKKWPEASRKLMDAWLTENPPPGLFQRLFMSRKQADSPNQGGK